MGRGRWPVELRDQYFGDVPPSRHLCWAHSARRQTCRTSSRAIHQIRIRHQSANRKNLRPANPAHAVRPRRRGDRVKRRDFFTLLGGAVAAWPLAARGQQPEKTPVVGFLSSESRSAFGHRLEGFHRSLAEAGYVEGKNVIVEYRWAEGQYGRVPGLADDLVHKKVSVIVANYPPVLEAKRATDTIPIVFTSAADPVKIGLVASLNRPGSNVTGIYLLAQALEAKRLDLLNELVTPTASIGALVNPLFRDADRQLHELQEAATVLKRKIQILHAGNNEE